jgi:hypothetical protein
VAPRQPDDLDDRWAALIDVLHAIELLRKKTFDLDDVITAQYDIEEAGAAFSLRQPGPCEGAGDCGAARVSPASSSPAPERQKSSRSTHLRPNAVSFPTTSVGMA